MWTAHHWQHWLDRGNFPDHPWRTFLQRSALTLKGLTYAPSGALLAAATTSLPETPQGERNWDYRYSWIRDSTFMLWALLSLGFEWEANDFFYFIADVAAGEENLQVMYGLDGERQLDEYILDHLEGYERARPVRVGNAAYEQKQHDVWGALLDSVYLHTRSRDSLDDRVWRILQRQVEQAIENWREPDRGIWEVRGEPKHFTSSKVFCWVACDRGARLAELREDFTRARRWREAADEIKADVLANGVDERGVFVQHYETEALDAALLLLPLMRFLPPDDERIRATVFAIADELTEGGLVLRYRTEETDDGLEGKEGTFLICSFWLVSALCEIGELDRARSLCERLLGYASPLGLYAEEIDPQTGRHLGNFPQAFTHLALINAVMHVIRADEEVAAARRPGLSGARAASACPGAARGVTGSVLSWLMKPDSTNVGGPGHLHLRVARQRLLEHDPQLQPRQRGAEAEVPAAGAERLVLGVAAHVEAVGVLVARRVAVGGDVPHDDLVALADRLAGELGVARGGAPEVGEGGEHAQRLLDGAGDQRRVVEQELALLGVLHERPHAAAVGGLGAVVARGHEQEEAHHDLVLLELLAVDLGVDEHGGEVVGGRLAPRGDQLGAAAEDLGDLVGHDALACPRARGPGRRPPARRSSAWPRWRRPPRGRP